MGHDFSTKRPVSADIYLFRITFHNWSIANVIKIMKPTVPAMQPGAHVVVNGYLIPSLEHCHRSKKERFGICFSSPIAKPFLFSRRVTLDCLSSN